MNKDNKYPKVKLEEDSFRLNFSLLYGDDFTFYMSKERESISYKLGYAKDLEYYKSFNI